MNLLVAVYRMGTAGSSKLRLFFPVRLLDEKIFLSNQRDVTNHVSLFLNVGYVLFSIRLGIVCNPIINV